MLLLLLLLLLLLSDSSMVPILVAGRLDLDGLCQEEEWVHESEKKGREKERRGMKEITYLRRNGDSGKLMEGMEASTGNASKGCTDRLAAWDPIGDDKLIFPIILPFP